MLNYIIPSNLSIDKRTYIIYNIVMDKRTKKWIILFAALLMVCIAAFLLLKLLTPAGNEVIIRIDGEIYEKIDLRDVTVAYDIEIESEYGYNKIHIAPDGVSVTEADCRDQICVKRGAVHQAGMPIVCMPHHLTVEIEGDEIDG